MHLDTTMELAAIRQREIHDGQFRRTAGRIPGRRLFTRHVRRTTGSTGTAATEGA
jgi:hypothetical protein